MLMIGCGCLSEYIEINIIYNAALPFSFIIHSIFPIIYVSSIRFISLATDLVKEHFKDTAGDVFEHLAGGGEGGSVSKHD